jgi:hypothetical protein
MRGAPLAVFECPPWNINKSRPRKIKTARSTLVNPGAGTLLSSDIVVALQHTLPYARSWDCGP